MPTKVHTLSKDDLDYYRTLKWPEVYRMTGTCRSTARTLKGFPRPIKIGKRGAGWIAGEVLDYVRKRAAERDQYVSVIPPHLDEAVRRRQAAKAS